MQKISFLVLALLVAGPAASQVPTKTVDGVLADSAGMTLYTFDRDTIGSGKSSCNGSCARNWPPYLARRADQPGPDYGIVTRDDGSKQWAYKGRPLYLWGHDQKSGDKTGDGMHGVWHVVRP